MAESAEKPLRRGFRTIFSKVLTGYLALTVLVVLLTGLVSFFLVRRNIRMTNLRDLSARAVSVADMVKTSEEDPLYFRPRRFRELESLTDSQIVIVNRDMVARQIPPGDRRRKPLSTPKPESTLASENAPQKTPGFPATYPGEIRGFEGEDRAAFEAFENDETRLLRINLAGSVDEALIRSILGGNLATDVRKLQFMSAPVLFAGAPVVDGETGEVVAAVILCRPETQVGQVARDILLLLSLAAVVALVCASLLALALSRRLTQPIRRLCVAAGRMAEGHYGESVPPCPQDETGQLGEALDTLSARLSTVIGTLSDEKSKLEKILSAIGEGIIAIDRAGNVIHHNASVLSLLEIESWDGESADAAFPEQKEKLLSMLTRSMDGETRLVTGLTTPGGRMLEAIASPVPGADGKLIGAVCLVRDVSEAQRLEQMRRGYIANISHELRTPLTGIRGMVEPLLDGMMDTEEEKMDCYRVIYQETIRLEKLIGDMLDLSRLQDGRVEIELEPLSPAGLMEACARRLRERAKAGGVELTVEGEPDLMVMGNEDRILQVYTILTDNALSFTQPGGRVTLFARREKKGVASLGVSDTGSGIAPADLPYIWERFYKADKSRMRTSGTGLGLSIAKLAVELMRGEIGVETEMGKGSTFTFTLPEYTET